MDKQRFKQLYALAHGGDLNAKADLWLEFEFDYDRDPLPAFMQEPSLRPLAPSCGQQNKSHSRSSASIRGSKKQQGGRPC